MKSVSAGRAWSNDQKIQNSNWGSDLGHFAGENNRRSGSHQLGKKSREDSGEVILRDFVWANRDLLDKEVRDSFFLGNKQAITEALNQIHWRSLKKRGGLDWENKPKIETVKKLENTSRYKTYAEVVASPEEDKKTAQSFKEQADEKEKWTVVQSRHKNKKEQQRKKSSYTIFLYNILDKVSAREMWKCFENTGEVLDIILPRKRDKRNKIYGFVKTSSELEAGKIILNDKERGGIAARIQMSINVLREENLRSSNLNPGNPLNTPKKSSIHINKSGEEKQESIHNESSQAVKNPKNDDCLGRKMFEYTESNLVDEEIRKGLFETTIGFSRSEDSTIMLQSKLDDVGLEKIRLAGLNERKFILRSEREDI